MNPIFLKQSVDALVAHFNSAMALGISGQADLANEVLFEVDELIISIHCQLGYSHPKERTLG